MEDFTAVRRRTLYQDIVGQVHDLITDGVLKPGDRLPPERELAERLKVSRSSLREAMRALELQGLLVSRPGAGTYVSTDRVDAFISIISSSLSQDTDVQKDIFEVRHLLEPQIAGLAAERATGDDLQQMREAVAYQKSQIASGGTGVEGDTVFHFALAQATHNWALLRVISTISDMLRQSRDRSLQTPGRPQRSLASHHQILEMIVRRDAQGAEAAMRYHISEVEPAFTSTQGESPTVAAGSSSMRNTERR